MQLSSSYDLRCGDTVFHRPSGETWIVAYAEGKWMSWCGWPDGTALVSDCDVIKRCSDEQHREAVSWFVTGSGGQRRAKVLALYGDTAKALQDDPVEPTKATPEPVTTPHSSWFPCSCGAEHSTPICPFGPDPTLAPKMGVQRIDPGGHVGGPRVTDTIDGRAGSDDSPHRD